MKGINKVTLLGNLTRDVETRTVPSGTMVAQFGIATNRQTVINGEKKDEVSYHNIVVWGKLAEICAQYLSKGKKIYLEGRIQYQQWDAPDGTKKNRTEIVMEDMVMLDGKNEGGSYSNNYSQSSPQEVESNESPNLAVEEISIDDIPF